MVSRIVRIEILKLLSDFGLLRIVIPVVPVLAMDVRVVIRRVARKKGGKNGLIQIVNALLLGSWEAIYGGVHRADRHVRLCVQGPHWSCFAAALVSVQVLPN
jgi:hypothetical protein